MFPCHTQALAGPDPKPAEMFALAIGDVAGFRTGRCSALLGVHPPPPHPGRSQEQGVNLQISFQEGRAELSRALPPVTD